VISLQSNDILNRRQEVFSRGISRLCRGLDILKFW